MSPYTKDIILAIIFFIYPFFLLLVSKRFESMGAGKDFTRKAVHIGMGLVILFIPFFNSMWIAIAPPVIFTFVNALDYRFGIFSQIQGEDRGNIGTVLYPISFILLIVAFFHTDMWSLAVLGILTMAFGDAAASLVGRRAKSRIYTVSGENRSYAGSFAMFIVTFFLSVLILSISHQALGITPRLFTVFAASFIIAGCATAVEALSIKGSDNITVPVLTALAAWLLITQFMPNVLGNQTIVQQPLF